MEENNKEITIHTPTEEEMKEAHENYMCYLRENPNNFSFWFPHLSAVKNHGIRVPQSYIIEVPEEIYKAFYQEHSQDMKKIRLWAHKKVFPVIQNHFQGKEVFVKNGCYSGKFSFNKNCHIQPNATLKEIVEHLCNIQYGALCHGFNGTGGYLEIVLREWIRPDNFTKTIYGGMPLRPEMRLFYDFDGHKPLYWVNYWDWDECHDYIAQTEDKEVYEEYYPYIDEEVKIYTTDHWDTICNALAQVTGLKGVWSVDFILQKDMVWFIDAAIGPMSAYWDPEKVKHLIHD